MFQSDQPLEFTLTANFKAVNGDRNPNSTKTFPATLEFAKADGTKAKIPLQIRARGHARRQICAFAPLRLELPKEQTKGTVFDGHGVLKLGTYCHNSFEEYVRRGWIDEQLDASCALYGRKSERTLAALERSMPDGARWTTPRGGFFTWLTLPGADAQELARRAADGGVGIVPGTLFFPDGRGGDNVRLSFSMVDESLIDAGIARLAELL